MANIFELPSKYGNITPEKAFKLQQMQFCDKCSFTTKQPMFGVFAVDEILRYQGSPFPASHTLCYPAVQYCICVLFFFLLDFYISDVANACSMRHLIRNLVVMILFFYITILSCPEAEKFVKIDFML